MDARAVDEDRAAGLMLGLLLGDAYDELDDTGVPAHGTCLAQLACFTLEGLIRASMRMTHYGLCHRPSVVWHAWCRWADLQGLGDAFRRRWAGGAEVWPDGWLAQIAPLRVRRGDAPATVAALHRSADPPSATLGSSCGHHALTRTMPVAIFGGCFNLPETARDLAGLTHGHPAALDASVEGVVLLAEILKGAPVGATSNASSSRGTAPHALHHGLMAARGAGSIREALALAAPYGRGAATVAGAFWGAAHGVGSLDADLVGRLEIGWVADRLARDAFAEVTRGPGGSNYSPAEDPTWWARYPGW